MADLRTRWSELDSEIIPVLDEDGVQVANGQMRQLPDGRYLYADDADGFAILSADHARRIGAPADSDEQPLTIASTDRRRALVHHASGDEYIVTLASVWRGDRCVGTRIIEAVGPISRDELGIDGPLEPSPELYDRIDAAVNLDSEDAEWLQAEEDAGRLTYPIGVR